MAMSRRSILIEGQKEGAGNAMEETGPLLSARIAPWNMAPLNGAAGNALQKAFSSLAARPIPCDEGFNLRSYPIVSFERRRYRRSGARPAVKLARTVRRICH